MAHSFNQQAIPKAVFLFDTTGYAAEPFTSAGWETTIIDMLNVGEYVNNYRATHTLDWDILEREDAIAELCKDATFIFGFPPCTDLAVSGAKHFAAKAKVDPLFQVKAVHLAQSVERIAIKAGVPWALENPVSRLATLWRQSDYIFHPWHYGKYLPEGDRHPDYPKYIPAQDRYSKPTCLWTSKDFILPSKKPTTKPVGWSPQTTMLGGSSARTKRIRSASPRGFFIALQKAWSET
jgi:hypothetical protein